MDKETVILTWVKSGIQDFYLSFELESQWQRYSLFFCHQGLEKICKAYYLGECSLRWESLDDESALKEINKVAKTLGHDIRCFVKYMQSREILPPYTTNHPYYSEDNLLDSIQAAYIEARYPVPKPFHLARDREGKERFRISSAPNNWYHDLLGETAPLKYARSMARALLKRIELDFSVRSPESKFSDKISNDNWTRFTNIFFKAE